MKIHAICITGLACPTLWSCGTMSYVRSEITTYPPHELSPAPEKVWIANAFNVKAKSYRENKELQFNRLVDETMNQLSTQFANRGAQTEIAPDQLISLTYTDSVMSRIRSVQATHGVFVTSFDAFFDQTHVEVTDDGKTKRRDAFYDIVIQIRYEIKDLKGLSFDTLISIQKYHSNRQVVSAALAVGPNIVDNDRHAREGIPINVETYLRCFFPVQEPRTRNLYLSKEFSKVIDAVDRAEFGEAFSYSEQLTKSKDTKTAASAYYVCAVLAEHDGDYQGARNYLRESMKRKSISDAMSMWQDYKHMAD